jgi:hypothetical protein
MTLLQSSRLLRVVFAFALIAGLPQPLLAQAAYHFECTEDLVVGYAFNEVTRAWGPSEFKGNKGKHRYILRHLTDDEKSFQPQRIMWGVFEGERGTILTCPDSDYGKFLCGNQTFAFALGVSSMRYQKYYQGGYVSGRDDNDDTPFIEIGRCKFRNGAK